jgi:hypothetical protein
MIIEKPRFRVIKVILEALYAGMLYNVPAVDDVGGGI